MNIDRAREQMERTHELKRSCVMYCKEMDCCRGLSSLLCNSGSCSFYKTNEKYYYVSRNSDIGHGKKDPHYECIPIEDLRHGDIIINKKPKRK